MKEVPTKEKNREEKEISKRNKDYFFSFMNTRGSFHNFAMINVIIGGAAMVIAFSRYTVEVAYCTY